MKRFMVIAAIAALAFAACGGGSDDPDPVHEHDFSGGWEHNAAQHWHECPVDGEKADLADHTVETWTETKAVSILADGEESGPCTVCAAAVTRAITKLTSMIEAVQINAGTFTMGSPEDEPERDTVTNNEIQHEVTLTKDFYMGIYPVTQKQYEDVMGELPASLSNDTYGRGAEYPVYYITWYDTLVFCNKLSVMEGLTPAYRIDGKTDPKDWGDVPTTSSDTWDAVEVVAGSNGWRLPTEAQWEYACRAGTTTAFNWGTDTITTDQANYNGGTVYNNSPDPQVNLGKTTEVGSYTPNDWGLYDMHGNVYEWCWDRYNADYEATVAGEAQIDPTGADSGRRVRRGGCFFNSGRAARSATRVDTDPYSRLYIYGFRLVRP